MAVFRFRLQKVLDYRENREKQLRRELSAAQQNLGRAEAELKTLKEKLATTGRNVQRQPFDPEQRLITDRYLTRLARRIHEQEEVVSDRRDEVARTMTAVQNAIRDRKSLGLLREKSLAAFLRNLDLREQKQNDEYSLFGYHRRS
jgi:flagellar FliJ protein